VGNPTVYLSVMNPSLRIKRSTVGGPTGANGRRIPDSKAAGDVLTGDQSLFTNTTVGDSPFLVYTLPVVYGDANDRVVEVVQTATSLAQYEDNIASLVKILTLVGTLGLAAAILITAFVTQRALLPIRTSLRRQRNFVADAAHELRTPLTIIRSTAEIGIGHSEGEEQQRAELTLKETSHLTRLVNDLSLLARADTGTLDFERTRLDLSSLIGSTASDVEVLAEDRGIHLETSVAKDIHVVGDTVRLRQLLLILLDNALKHSPEGGTVRVRLENVRRRAILRVQDSGPGIAAQDLPHIFDRFYQSDSARSGEGTGLGLAIAQSITQGQHGSISAGNSSSGGAVFTVSFPVAA
jgi:two-component system, OmpR family, sensor histidine kinase CiaH